MVRGKKDIVMPGTGTENVPRPCVVVPDFGGIDLGAIAQKLGLAEDNVDFSQLLLSKAMEIVLDAVFDKFVPNTMYRKRSYKSHRHSVKWELKKYECYLAVYLQDATLAYTVRVNTVNSDAKERLSVIYYSYEHMVCYPWSLLRWVLRDFSQLVHEAVGLEYTFESAGDGLPSGTYRERSGRKVPFFWLHEDVLMTPMHYYDGTGYPHHGGECKPCPFGDWFPDLGKED